MVFYRKRTVNSKVLHDVVVVRKPTKKIDLNIKLNKFSRDNYELVEYVESCRKAMAIANKLRGRK